MHKDHLLSRLQNNIRILVGFYVIVDLQLIKLPKSETKGERTKIFNKPLAI